MKEKLKTTRFMKTVSPYTYSTDPKEIDKALGLEERMKAQAESWQRFIPKDGLPYTVLSSGQPRR